jgi:hypothetical protein
LELNGKKGAYTDSKSVNIEAIYDDIGGCNNKSFCVKNGASTGIVDASGNILYPLEYDHIGTFEDSILFLHKGTKMQIVNFYTQKLISVVEVDQVLDGSYNLSFDYNATSRLTPMATNIYDRNWLIVRKKDKFGMMRRSGEIIAPLIYDNVVPAGGTGDVLVFINGKGGLYSRGADGTFKQILACQYDAIKLQCYLTVSENGLWGVIDFKGNVLITPQFDETALSSFQDACKKIDCHDCDMDATRSKQY